jgi:membrane-associated phospholipid phosphatase
MKKIIILFLTLTLFSIDLIATDEEPGKYEIKLDPLIDTVTLSLGTLAMSSYFFNSRLRPSMYEVRNLDRSEVNKFDRFGTYLYNKESNLASDVVMYSLIASPLALYALAETRDGFWSVVTPMVLFAESVMLTNGTTRVLKVLTSRYRPYMYNTDLTVEERFAVDEDPRFSFPSNHTANAFNAAFFISTYYTILRPNSRWIPLVWTLSLTGASAVGALRVVAGRHFLSDVLVGAAIGAITGSVVPLVHLKTKGTFSVAPIATKSYSGISCTFVY